MRRISVKAMTLPLVLAAVLTSGRCSDEDLAPFQPEITSATDSFQLEADDVTNQTATLTFGWTNTGTRARVIHSTTTTFGRARLMIEDAEGEEVYDKTLAPSLNDSTTAGASGDWTIRLVLSDYTGTLNFTVQKL